MLSSIRIVALLLFMVTAVLSAGLMYETWSRSDGFAIGLAGLGFSLFFLASLLGQQEQERTLTKISDALQRQDSSSPETAERL